MEELLRIEDFSVEYRTGEGIANAVNHANLIINKGEAIGLVGESGAGKTTIALSILRLLPDKIGYVTSGDIKFHGKSLYGMKERQLEEIRGEKISMIFANPLTSLNPVFSIGQQIELALMQHRRVSKAEAHAKAAKMLETVGIPAERLNDYPHQFSGGMRQRVGIAAALICSPELLIADEPTTALDVTIQAQILELMKELQKEYKTSLLMITHNLGIVAELCQKVAIMYGGEIVEYGSVAKVFSNPMHRYTIGLLHAIPQTSGERLMLASIPGTVANAKFLPDGCRFHPRCKDCAETCKQQRPPMIKIDDDHYVSCWGCENE